MSSVKVSIGSWNKITIRPTQSISPIEMGDPQFITRYYHSKLVMGAVNDNLELRIQRDDQDVDQHLEFVKDLYNDQGEIDVIQDDIYEQKNETSASLDLRENLDNIHSEYRGSKAEIFEALFNSTPIACDEDRESFIVKGDNTGDHYLVENDRKYVTIDPITEYEECRWIIRVRRIL